MGWITFAGKTLEFTGQVIQSASFEEWATSKGEEIIEGLAKERAISLFGRKHAAKKQLLGDLRIATRQPVMRAALSKLASTYSSTIANAAETFETNEYIADGKTYVVPRLLFNPSHRALLRTHLDQSDEFQTLKGGPKFREYFYDEFVQQLDYVVMSMRLAPSAPWRLDQTTWYVVGTNSTYDWRAAPSEWKGHVFIHGFVDRSYGKQRKFAETAPLAAAQVEDLEQRLGLLTLDQKKELSASWIATREAALLGRRERPMTLLSEAKGSK